MAQLSPSRTGWSELRRSPDDPRPPAPLVVAIAFAAEIGWVALAQTTGLTGVGVAFGVVAIALVVSWWLTVTASLTVAVMSFLVVDGFAEHQTGQLGWSGNRDGILLLVLLAGCALVAELRSGVVEEHLRRRSRGR